MLCYILATVGLQCVANAGFKTSSSPLRWLSYRLGRAGETSFLVGEGSFRQKEVSFLVEEGSFVQKEGSFLVEEGFLSVGVPTDRNQC